MILDCLENWSQYPLGAAWERAFEFLMRVKPDAEEGRHPLQGEDLYALVASSQTRPAQEARLEAHREYVDIHAPLSGVDRIEWAPTEGLVVDKPYDASNDAVLFARPQQAVRCVDITPGLFVAFFPQDAHAPQLMVGDAPETVKKVVVKIRMELLNH